MPQLIADTVAKAIYEQIGLEYFAAMQYEAISAWFRQQGLPRLSAYYATQAAEERDHAHRFSKFILDAGALLELPGIPAPRCRFESAEDAVAVALEHEMKVTDSIKALLDLAEEAGDRFTENSLQWFIQEQLTEVSAADELLQIVKRAGEGGLLVVEHFLATQGGPGK